MSSSNNAWSVGTADWNPTNKITSIKINDSKVFNVSYQGHIEQPHQQDFDELYEEIMGGKWQMIQQNDSNFILKFDAVKFDFVVEMKKIKG